MTECDEVTKTCLFPISVDIFLLFSDVVDSRLLIKLTSCLFLISADILHISVLGNTCVLSALWQDVFGNRYRCIDRLTAVNRFTRPYVFTYTSLRVPLHVRTCFPSRPYVFAFSSLRVSLHVRTYLHFRPYVFSFTSVRICVFVRTCYTHYILVRPFGYISYLIGMYRNDRIVFASTFFHFFDSRSFF